MPTDRRPRVGRFLGHGNTPGCKENRNPFMGHASRSQLGTPGSEVPQHQRLRATETRPVCPTHVCPTTAAQESENLSLEYGADFLSRKMGANELTATTESFRFCARSSPQFPRMPSRKRLATAMARRGGKSRRSASQAKFGSAAAGALGQVAFGQGLQAPGETFTEPALVGDSGRLAGYGRAEPQLPMQFTRRLHAFPPAPN
jgi:hypothetical protein